MHRFGRILIQLPMEVSKAARISREMEGWKNESLEGPRKSGNSLFRILILPPEDFLSITGAHGETSFLSPVFDSSVKMRPFAPMVCRDDMGAAELILTCPIMAGYVSRSCVADFSREHEEIQVNPRNVIPDSVQTAGRVQRAFDGSRIAADSR